MAVPIFPRFFITHSWRDNDFAQLLVDDLKACGMDGFFDVYSIHPGDNIPKRISEGLDACDVYIPILSNAAFSSPWCDWELSAAIQLRNTRGRQGRPKIIPLLVDDCQDKIPAILRPVAYIDFVGRYDKAFEQLLVRGLGVQSTILKRDGKRLIPGQALLPFMDTTFDPPLSPPSQPRLFALPSEKARARNAKLVLMIGALVSMIAVVTLIAFFTGIFDQTTLLPMILAAPTQSIAATAPLGARMPTGTTSSASQATPQLTNAPTAVMAALPTPPASIDNPLCPQPNSVFIASPLNGSLLSGSVQIRGTVAVRGGAQPYRYSLFYRPGIVRDAMDSNADAQAPLSANQSNGRNIPIQVVYFNPFDGPIIDDVLGSWDTTKVSAGWYSVRLWNKDRGGNYVGCDVYVYVKGQ